MTDKEIKRSQELDAQMSDMAAEIKRLQEREWVGLTDEDRKNFYQGKHVISDDFLMDAVEAKLKEKNHVS